MEELILPKLIKLLIRENNENFEENILHLF